MISQRWVSDRRVHRDDAGHVRLIEAGISYERLVDRAFDKIRQAGRGMPAVVIRQIDSVGLILETAERPDHRAVLRAHADMLVRSIDAIADPGDRADVQARYDRLPT